MLLTANALLQIISGNQVLVLLQSVNHMRTTRRAYLLWKNNDNDSLVFKQKEGVTLFHLCFGEE